ncbi:hypothetical protein BB558_004068 [Smittium angustum]|uniref:Uncharacterized protein n=1 Tax=Smittium angustum TaxID=133377 RepID=A0A2U1J494_SMIAN|nr:hypothetical protein BB558_004068 [Smittium angustum]
MSPGSIPGQWLDAWLGGQSEGLLSYYVWEPTNQRKTPSGVLAKEQQPRTVPMLDG